MAVSSEQSSRWEPPFALAAVGVLVSSICFGVVPYFSRGLTDQGMAPQAVAFSRYVITAFVLLPVLVMQRAAWREVLWGMVAGASMGFGWIGYVSALEVIPASTMGVLYMTYPVFTVLIAWVLFGEGPTRRALLASGMIFLAAVVAGNPTTVAPEHLMALLFSLAAPVGFGLSIAVLVHRLTRLPPLARVASVSMGSVLALLPIILATDPVEVIPQSGSVWVLAFGLAIGSALVPQLIYTSCSPVIGTSRSAVLGSVELPTMFAIGVFVFGERLTLAQGVACLLVLAAMILIQSRATRNVMANISKPPK